MKLGFNMLLWTTFVTDEHWPIIEALKATGYNGVEIPMFEGEVAHYQRLGQRLKSAGLKATGVGVMSGGSAISSDPQRRQRALDHIKWLIDCTAAVGGDLACGPLHQPLGEFSGGGPTDDQVAWCAEIHKAAAKYGATAGVSLVVEPLNRFECYFLNTMAQSAALVSKVDEPNYGFLFDTFHTNIEENAPVELIRKYIKQIKHVHISENNRGVPGDGHIDFASVFGALKSGGYDAWMTIEAFGMALPDLAAATKIWRPLFASESDVYRKGYRLMREGWDAA